MSGGDVRECRACGRAVIWAVTEHGRWIALDPAPNDAGNQEATRRDHLGRVLTRQLRAGELPEPFERMRMPHAATCAAVPTRPSRRPRPTPPHQSREDTDTVTEPTDADWIHWNEHNAHADGAAHDTTGGQPDVTARRLARRDRLVHRIGAALDEINDALTTLDDLTVLLQGTARALRATAALIGIATAPTVTGDCAAAKHSNCDACTACGCHCPCHQPHPDRCGCECHAP